MYNQCMNSRSKYMDMAKGIGIFAVIVAHIGVGKIGIWLYSFHLPLFFIISGYFFQFQENFICFIKKKSKGYLVPYIGCAIIIALFDFIRGRGSNYIFVYSLIRFGFQRRYTTLWFLATLFVAVILFWIICKICKNNIARILICCTAFSLGFILYDEYIGVALPWNIDTAFIVLLYLAVGYVCRQFSIIEKIAKNDKHWVIIAVLIIINIVCTICNYFICGETYEMFAGQYGVFPLTIAAACAGSLAIILMCYFCSYGEVFRWIGENSMSFFAFHQSIGIPIMICFCDWIDVMNVSCSWLQSIITKGIILTGTMLICYLMHFIIIKSGMKFILG